MTLIKDESLPILDLAVFPPGSLTPPAPVVDALSNACRTTGFFYVRNHGISRQLLDRIKLSSRDFFDLPEAAKRRYVRAKGTYRGYIPMCAFATDLHSGATFPYEAFVFGEEAEAGEAEVLRTLGLFAPNRWPESPPEFAVALREYWTAVSDLSARLLRACAAALGASPDAITASFERPLSNASMLHYPGREEGTPHPQTNGHVDTDVLTILLPSELGGLEVQLIDGVWQEVEPLPDCFVVNIGTLLTAWSGNRFRSTLHRVCPIPGKDRYSLAFFACPRFGTKVMPLDPADATEDTVPVDAGQQFADFVAGFDA